MVTLHTVHFNNQIFTVQKNGTSILAFRKPKDAHRFSKLIESHYDITYEWPKINFDDTLLFKKQRANRLKYVEVLKWGEDDLVDWCINNAFNLLDIYEFEEDNKLVGKSIFWEVDQDFYKSFLDNKLTL